MSSSGQPSRSPILNRTDIQPKIEILAQEDIDERLRKKRKNRGQKACYPCRHRKVGCNYEKPCQKCIDRNHPELCIYDPVSKRANLEPPEGSKLPITPVSHASGPAWERIAERLSQMERSMQELREELGYLAGSNEPFPSLIGRSLPDRPMRDLTGDEIDQDTLGMHTSNAITGQTVHLGANSVPAMVLALGKGTKEDDVQDLLGKSILPLFGLDNESATYPFVDLWGLPHGSYARIEGLCKLLPNDSDCLDINNFESDLTQFLTFRAAEGNASHFEAPDNHVVYGKNLHWLGLLFATLASGCQCSSLPRKERQLTCQVYVCCAYECLRIINYLSNSTLLDIQTLLVLGNVISNNMNSGVTWSLLGLTIRIGQSLGLHQKASRSLSDSEGAVREEIWWRIVWQDSLISISFDRASSTPTISHHNKPDQHPTAGTLPYADCMKVLCETGLEIVRERHQYPDLRHELHHTRKHQEDITRMMEQALHYLKDPNSCKSMRDQLEHWNLYLHRSYILSELYRSAWRHKDQSPELENLRIACVENLANTVEAFLGLQNVTRFATQSWAAVHRALSSALLLGILKRPQTDQRAWTLIDKLLGVMSSINSSLDPSEMSAPIRRAVMALSRLNSHHSPAGSNLDTSGTPPVVNWEAVNQWDPMALGDDRSQTSSADIPRVENTPHDLMEKILWGSQTMHNRWDPRGMQGMSERQ